MKAIQANPTSISKLFAEYEFAIPEFQRPYSWEVDDCVQLWDDIISHLGKDGSQEKYFLGSIVVYPCKGNDKVLSIIDGQQRLTTLLMLLKILHEKATTMSVLQDRIYKTDPKTGRGKVSVSELRLESEVLASDKEDFQKIMGGQSDKMPKKNPFKLNYAQLKRDVEKWFKGKEAPEAERFIISFLDNLVMLPILCDSQDDALTLFKIINDRGKHLDDADIFKADLYQMTVAGDRSNFIKRWNELNVHKKEGHHEELFRIYMHILRAHDNDVSKEIALRPYIAKHLKKPEIRDAGSGGIMSNLEDCNNAQNDYACTDNVLRAKESICWSILDVYPNLYWRYPLYVFLLENKNRDSDVFCLNEDKQEEYISLLESTIRYFYIKGVVHNAVNTVKDTTFKAYVAIAGGRDYLSEYKNNIKKDRDAFFNKLKDGDYGRCLKGLVMINSWLNPAQNLADYANMLESKFEIEHILPNKWRLYGGWDERAHEENLNRIGNLMPLEKACNAGASNEFFAEKQKYYKKSKVQDALDLSKQESVWYPAHVETRNAAALVRLEEFFAKIYE